MAPATKSASTSPRIINKNLSQANITLNTFLAKTGGGAFKHIANRAVIASQLRLRINQPWLINQRESSLCGAAAFMYCIAKDYPAEYVQYVIDLFETGTGKIGALVISPSEACLNASLSGYSMHAVDWIALASLRDSENSILSYDSPSDATAGITLPSSMVDWFSACGYKSVTNQTNLYFDKGIPELAKANQAFLAGKNVCLFISSKAINAKKGVSIIPNHWVILGSIIKSGSNPLAVNPSSQQLQKYQSGVLSITATHWGMHQDNLNPNKLSAESFMEYYFGAVVAG